LSKIKYLLVTVLLAMVVTSVQAQNSSKVSPAKADPRTVKIQRKVDQLFERGSYERAYLIYRNDLAPLGDKYAQYMVGFMNLTGKGTEKDRIAASAWLRLAAERDTPEFVQVRDLVLRDMQPAELEQSKLMYKRFRHEFSDLAILLATIKTDHEELRRNRGSVLNQSAQRIAYYNLVHAQMEERLVTLSKLGDFPGLETDPGSVNMEDVESMVHARLDEAFVDETPAEETFADDSLAD
jgi:hypothetical protein